MNEQTDTPETAQLLTLIYDNEGELSERNAPEKWVVFSRQLERELNALRAEVEKLKADKVRLDWMESEGNGNGWIARQSTTGRGFRLHNDSNAEADTCRDAIDAAMKGDK